MPGEPAFPLAVGFLGAGQMATALAIGWAKAGLLDAARSRAADPYPAARAKFAGRDRRAGRRIEPRRSSPRATCWCSRSSRR